MRDLTEEAVASYWTKLGKVANYIAIEFHKNGACTKKEKWDIKWGRHMQALMTHVHNGWNYDRSWMVYEIFLAGHILKY